MVFKLTILFAAIVATTLALPSPKDPAKTEEDGIERVYRFLQDCGNKELSMCLKMRALTFVDSALREGDVVVTDGVTLMRTGDAPAVSAKSGRALTQAELESTLPSNDEERATQVDTLLVDRVARFLQTHTLQFQLPQSSISDMKRSIEEGRKKKKKLLLPLLLAIKLKAAALIPLVIGGLAVLAFKALVIGKIAFVLSALVALQKLLGGQQHKTVEVVSHGHYDHDHYGRSIQDGQNLAYNAHAPNSQ